MMKKIFNIPIVLGLALSLTLFSCIEDQEPVAPISPDDYPVATFTTDFSATEVSEGDVITYTIKLDKWLDHDVSFGAMVKGGTGDAHDIVNVGGVIPAYSDSTVLQVIFVQDYDIDDAETLELEIGADYLGTQYTINPSTVNPTHNVTVANWVGPLEMTFDWHADLTISQLLWDINGDVYYGDIYDEENAADYVDFDIYMATAEGYDPADPWANYFGYDAAETGDVPEEMVFADTIPDGDYVLFAFLYGNDLPDYDSIGYEVGHIDLPITISYVRAGAINAGSFVQPSDQVINSTVPGWANDDFAHVPGPLETTLCKISFADGMFTVYEMDDTEVATGKASDFKLPSLRSDYVRIK